MFGLSEKYVSVSLIVDKTVGYISSGKNPITLIPFGIIGMTTAQLDSLLAETAAYLTSIHPDYGKLAGRIAVTRLQKETSDNYLEVVQQLHHPD